MKWLSNSTRLKFVGSSTSWWCREVPHAPQGSPTFTSEKDFVTEKCEDR